MQHTAPQVKLSPLIEEEGGIRRGVYVSAPMMEHEQQMKRLADQQHKREQEESEFERAIEEIERGMDREERDLERAVDKEKRLRKKDAEKTKAKKVKDKKKK